MVIKLVQLKHVTTRPGGGATSRRSQWKSGGKAPSCWAIFCNVIWTKFRTFSGPLERTKFLKFESQLNKFLPLLQVKPKTRSKSCILGLNFVTWPGQGNQGTLLSATFLALNHSLEDLVFEDPCFVMKITSFRDMYNQDPRHP